MKKKKRKPRAMTWTYCGGSFIAGFGESFVDGRKIVCIGERTESGEYGIIATKSQCRKLIAWLEKAMEHLEK